MISANIICDSRSPNGLLAVVQRELAFDEHIRLRG